MKRIYFITGWIMVALTAFGQPKYVTEKDIPYYSGEVNNRDSYIKERCVLDIYYPQNKKDFTTIVWFHGGGLTMYEKEIPEGLKNKALCIVAVNYRLHPKVTCPKYIEDAAAAVAWVFNNIEKYGGDTQSIFVAGHSAGGFLTAMIGLDKRWLEVYNIDANRIAGLIPCSSPSITHATIRKEHGIEQLQPVIDEWAPVYHVRADAPPLLLMTGDREMEALGRYDENAYWARMMKLVGHKRTILYEFEGYGHDMMTPAYPLLIKFVYERAKELRNSTLLPVACSNPDSGSESESMDKFVTGLMAQMTIDEKIGQLNLSVAGDITTGQLSGTDIAKKIRDGQVGGLFNIKGVDKIRKVQQLAVEESRLKIPLLFGMDVIHGYETVFPVPLGLSCTWDPTLIEQSARIAAIEASADGICWTFSPMVDICRDARWGRIVEGSGEDPFLGAEIAKAMVRGYQGDNPALNNTILACVKHFALYGASEAGRDYNTVDMSRIRMYNEYFPPYKAAIEAGCGSVMASFNEVDGVPATANQWLMTDVLRDQWKFNGFVVSDYTGVSEMVEHGTGDLKAVSARALNAGTDMDMVSEGFISTLNASLQDGTVSEITINAACRRILEAKYKLGLFDDPYKYCDKKRALSEIYTEDHLAFTRKIAAESFVLLKNENHILPLKKQGVIAVTGPLADIHENMLGTWSVAADAGKPMTFVEGMRESVGDKAKIVYAKGSNVSNDESFEKRISPWGKRLNKDNRSNKALQEEALQIAGTADVVVAVLGELSEMSGESSSRTNIEIPDVQKDLLKALIKTGKPVVLVLFTGRPLALKWENEHVHAILNTWFGGSESARAIADVLFGDVNPSGKLTTSFPQHVGQIPVYYNHKNTGRPLNGEWFQNFRSNYLDVSNEPLYPFGFGLSYTSFRYGDVKLSADTLSSNQRITASIDITNTGNVAGKEIVQLYIRDRVGSVTRPVKELKGFQKITLEPGESETVNFEITPELLKFYDYNLNFVCEPGDFDVMIGANSKELKSIKLQNSLTF